MNIKIVYFSSPDCSICVNQTSILKDLQSEMQLDVENHLITTAFDKALTYGIKSAPAIVFLHDNRPQVVKTGFQSKEQIKEIIEMITSNIN
jgi:predicted DsbA family dithiol-disulfide isomerase